MDQTKTAGFTLIEVMVAMGIMSLVAVGYMHITQQRAKEERTQRINKEIEVFTSNVRNLFSTHGSCKSTFENIRIVNKNSISIPEIKNGVGVSIYSDTHAHTGGLFELTGLNLEEIKSSIEQGNETMGTLNIGFQKKGSILGASLVKRGIEIYFYLNDDGSVQACSPLSMLNEAPKAPSIPSGVPVEVDEEMLEKAIKDNPELQYAKEMLKQMQENQNKLLKLQENLHDY
jgi:prepilin-type N-terminal cleavage/methylation domain-containing protein